MNITKSTTTLTCPHCREQSTYDLTPQELADGRRVVCGKCGREIAIDRGVFEKVEELLDHPPASGLFSTTTVVKSSMSFTCPRCGKTTTTTDMTVGRLIEGEKVFCSHCGGEIHVDGAKIQEADAALRGTAPPVDGGKILDIPGGPVVVRSKSFSFNVNKTVDSRKKADTGAGAPAGGHTPIITPRHAIEPKRGCLGVMGVFLPIVVAGVICGLLAW